MMSVYYRQDDAPMILLPPHGKGDAQPTSPPNSAVVLSATRCWLDEGPGRHNVSCCLQTSDTLPMGYYVIALAITRSETSPRRISTMHQIASVAGAPTEE